MFYHVKIACYQYACAEGNCLHFLCQHQSNLRVNIYKGAQDAMYQGNTDA